MAVTTSCSTAACAAASRRTRFAEARWRPPKAASDGAFSVTTTSVVAGVDPPYAAPERETTARQRTAAVPTTRTPFLKMRMRGLEPPRPYGHTDLNRARLPIPPHPRARVIVASGIAAPRDPRRCRYPGDVRTEPLLTLLERAFPDATELDVV